MTLPETLGGWTATLGGVAGVTLLYVITMIILAVARHKRDARAEERQIRIERMVRDQWIDWLRRERK